eukprot:jgi/Galph1/5026/GphlegSOOS_G3660.1
MNEEKTEESNLLWNEILENVKTKKDFIDAPLLSAFDWQVLKPLLKGLEETNQISASLKENASEETQPKLNMMLDKPIKNAQALEAVTHAATSGQHLDGSLKTLQESLKTAESNYIEEYVQEGSHVSSLRDKILECESELGEVESLIQHWSTRLLELCASISNHHHEAETINNQLMNRKLVQGNILQFLENITFSSELVSGIMDLQPSSNDFARYVEDLQEKVEFLQRTEVKESTVFKDVYPFAQKLVLRATEKIREHLHAKLQMLLNPNTNVQIIQQNVLMKQKIYFLFVRKCSYKTYKEMQDTYANTILRIYQSLFKKYLDGLLALKDEVNAKGEVLVDESSIGQNLKLSMGMLNYSNHPNVFVLGNRIQTLQSVEEPALVLAITRERGKKLFIEEIFRCVVKLLVDTCTSEYLFGSEIFEADYERIANRTLKDVFTLCLSVFEKHLEASYDLFGCLLIIKLNDSFRSTMESRNISLMDEFFLKIDIILKPRFQELVQSNLQSITQTSSKSLFPGVDDLSPLALTRRYAEFASGLVQVELLSNGNDKMVEESIKRLRVEFLGLLNRIGSHYSRKKFRGIFLVNNIDLICSIFEERRLTLTEEYSFYESMLSKQMTNLADFELEEHFADMMSLYRQVQYFIYSIIYIDVEQTSQYSKNQKVLKDISKKRVEKILIEFSSNWKTSLEHIRDNTFHNFPNFERGTEVRKRTMAKLLSCCRDIYQLVEENYSDIYDKLPSLNSLVHEIRKYVENF